MKRLIVTLAVVMLIAAPTFAAKEKANKTKCRDTADKCIARVMNIGSSGCDGVRSVVARTVPILKRLVAAGEQERARKVATQALRRIDHRGHVTVLKIAQTGDTCIAKLKRKCGDEAAGLVREVQGAAAAATKAMTATVAAARDVFFDIIL